MLMLCHIMSKKSKFLFAVNISPHDEGAGGMYYISINVKCLCFSISSH